MNPDTNEVLTTKKSKAIQFRRRQSLVTVAQGIDISLTIAACLCYDDVFWLSKQISIKQGA